MYVIPAIAFAIVIVIAAAWSPLFALIIAIPMAMIFVALMLLNKRPREGAGRTSEEAASERSAPSPKSGPRSGGKPASGEGGAPAP